MSGTLTPDGCIVFDLYREPDMPPNRCKIICDCGRIVDGEILGDEYQMLEWTCPECGLQRDVNA